MIWWLMTVILIVCVVFLILYRQKSPSDITAAYKIETISTDIDKTTALKTIEAFAQTGGYKVASIDAPNFSVLLSDEASLVTWGFFYPINLRTENNLTIISIGIRSKAVQIGPIVSHRLEKCVDGIQAALSAKMDSRLRGNDTQK